MRKLGRRLMKDEPRPDQCLRRACDTPTNVQPASRHAKVHGSFPELDDVNDRLQFGQQGQGHFHIFGTRRGKYWNRADAERFRQATAMRELERRLTIR